MSELVPFFEEDEQLDDNLLRSIETLLDDNEQNMTGCDEQVNGANGISNVTSMPSPFVESPFGGGSTFSFDNQVYQKWSTNESSVEMQNATMPKRNYNRNVVKPSNFPKPIKKNVQPSAVPTPPRIAQSMNAQIAQCQAILAEKANQLLNEYLRLNYEFLSAQAQILGIPLDQYIRNLLVALQTQSLIMPQNQFLYSPPISPVQTMTMPNFQVQQSQQQPQQQQQQRAFGKQYFANKKN